MCETDARTDGCRCRVQSYFQTTRKTFVYSFLELFLVVYCGFNNEHAYVVSKAYEFGNRLKLFDFNFLLVSNSIISYRPISPRHKPTHHTFDIGANPFVHPTSSHQDYGCFSLCTRIHILGNLATTSNMRPLPQRLLMMMFSPIPLASSRRQSYALADKMPSTTIYRHSVRPFFGFFASKRLPAKAAIRHSGLPCP